MLKKRTDIKLFLVLKTFLGFSSNLSLQLKCEARSDAVLMFKENRITDRSSNLVATSDLRKL